MELSDTSNHFFVGARRDVIVVGRPVMGEISREEALNLAAWLRVLADPLDKDFERLVKAIRNT